MKDITVWAVRTEKVKRLDLSPVEAAMPRRAERSRRYYFEKDRLLCMGAGYLLMKGLGIQREEEILLGANGKPFAPGYPAFSLSHSGTWCILACGKQRAVGADIEQINEKNMDVAPIVYTSRERQWMAADPADRFFRLWTWKESVMKATGLGMALEPGSFEVLPFAGGQPVFLLGRAWHARGGSLEGYRYSVCSDEPIGQVKWTLLE